jgi:hypothetical protein
VGDRGLSRASDDDVLALAVAKGRVLVSEDTDFGALIARSGARVPSFVLIRAAEPLTPDDHFRSSRRTEPPSLVGTVPCGPVTSSSAP